jgi:hypothetical protein
MLEVVRALRAWLQAPDQASPRRAFAEWMAHVLLPGRMPGVKVAPIHDLQEAETMLAERVKQWTEEWKREELQQGLQEGREETRRAIAKAMLDIVTDDALLAERTGLPVEAIATMRREAVQKQ